MVFLVFLLDREKKLSLCVILGCVLDLFLFWRKGDEVIGVVILQVLELLSIGQIWVCFSDLVLVYSIFQW